MKEVTLDYSVLDSVPTKAEEAVFLRDHPNLVRNRTIGRFLAIAVMLAVIILIGVGVSGLASGRFTIPPSFLVVVLIISTLLSALLVFSGKYRIKRLIRLSKFALANGMIFKFDSTVEKEYNGLIFDNGHSRMIVEALTMKDSSIEIGKYRYVTGSGKNSSTHSYGYAKIKLERHVPNMLLDATSNNPFVGTNLPDAYKRTQKLSLEGDFDKYFTLYTPIEYETDALYIFTPDVMLSLINHGTDFDIELVDNYLYIYSSRKPFESKESIQKWINVALLLSEKIGKQSRLYSDDTVTVDAVSSPSVADQGKRLKKGKRIGGLLLIAWFGLIALSPFFDGLMKSVISLAISGGLLGLIILGLIMNLSNLRRGF